MGNKIIYPVLLIIGFGLGMLYVSPSSKKQVAIDEASFIFQQLSSLGDVEIQENSCEFIGRGGDIIENGLRVSSFLSSYLNMSTHYKSKNFYSYLECGDKSENICSFSFGESKSRESWGRYLWFAIDPEKQIIQPNSFSCVGIP